MSDNPLLIDRILDGLGRWLFIDAGYSADRKYLVEGCDGRRYVLRVSSIEHRTARYFEFKSIGELCRQGVRCAETIRFGVEQDVCFCLYTYVEGDSASDALPKLTENQQHEFGLQAGHDLRLIHQALKTSEPVDERAIREGKFERFSSRLNELGISFEGQEVSERFVRDNVRRLEGRPVSFRHGDYHPGNLIAKDGEFSGVIDFNRCDWGDPYDDFYKTAFFGAPVSARYANGLIRGYFQGSPPDDFWPLYNVYVAATLPADIVWAEALFPEELPDAMMRVENITRTHDFVTGGPPEWWS